VINWLNTHVNPWISIQGLHADLAWFQATSSGYYQLGLVLSTESEEVVPYSLHHYDLRSLTRSPGRWGSINIPLLLLLLAPHFSLQLLLHHSQW
jgi:hypothetical protein